MNVITYQGERVLRILKSGEVYRARKNVGLQREYDALIDILGLKCECPVFGCLKYHRKCTNGRVSSSVKLELKVPDELVKLTEYSVWADFIYFLKNTKPTNYKRLASDAEEINQRKLNKMIHSLKKQKSPWSYRVPQTVMEEIRPEWLVKYELHPRTPRTGLFR